MSFIKNLLLNLFLISLAFTPTLFLNAFIRPYNRGFYCDDETIRKPKLDSEQINIFLLVFLSTFLPIVIISIANWLTHNRYQCRQQEHTAIKLTLNDVFLLLFGHGLA